jgi:hypothetical protein
MTDLPKNKLNRYFLITEQFRHLIYFLDERWHFLRSFVGTVTILLDLQSNGVTVPLHTFLLFVVTSNYFVTIKIKVTSNCNGTATMKSG